MVNRIRKFNYKNLMCFKKNPNYWELTCFLFVPEECVDILNSQFFIKCKFFSISVIENLIKISKGSEINTTFLKTCDKDAIYKNCIH